MSEFNSEFNDVRIINGGVTLELHGYLTALKINIPEPEDIEGGEYTLAKTLFESGIHTAAIEKAIINESMVSMAYMVKSGDYIILYPKNI